MVMETFSVISQFNLPPWTTAQNFGESAEIFRDQGEIAKGHDLFIWEAIPKGESFDSWSKLYAITAEYAMTGELEQYVNGQINRSADTCENISHQFFDATPSSAMLFIVICDSYKDQPETGEISILNMQILNKTLVKNYIHIRGPKFSLDKIDEYPAPVDEIERLLKYMNALRLQPKSSTKS